MEQPDLLIRKVKTLLQPSGQVFIEIPIFTKWSERLKSGWFHLDYPRHLALMTLDGFAHIIQKHGFTIVEKHSFSCEFSAPSLFISLSNAIVPKTKLYEKAHITNPRALQRYFYSWLILAGSFLCLIPVAFLVLVGQSDVMRLRLTIDES